MRAAFGLVGILISLGVILLILKATNHPAEVMEASKQAKTEAQRVGSVDDQGMRVADSITLAPYPSSGRLQGVLVSRIVAGGPMETYYGLRANDVILEVGPLAFKDSDDFELAKSNVQESRMRAQEMKVLREGRTIVLPRDRSVGSVAPSPAQTAQPQAAQPQTAQPPTAAPAPQPAPRRGGSIQRTLETIQNAAASQP